MSFTYDIAPWVPYKNKEVLERVRNMSIEELLTPPKDGLTHPDFKIHLVGDPGAIWIGDMVARIQASDILDKKVVMILPHVP